MAHNSAPTQVTVATSKTQSKWLGKWFLIPLFVVICIVVAVCLISRYNQDKSTARANTKEQKVLQTNLAIVLGDSSNSQGVVTDAKQLIAGAAAGRFTLSNSTLGQYHLDAATAFTNLGNYAQAAAQYEAVPGLNSSLKLAALQGEVEARYNIGQRKQLIPIYQELIPLENNSGDPMRSSVVTQYQENIQALQHNQGLNF